MTLKIFVMGFLISCIPEIKGGKDPCSSYTKLTESDREKTFTQDEGKSDAADLKPNKWYRFIDDAGFKLANRLKKNKCVAGPACGAMYPGFMLGVNPKKIGKTVKKKVCFHEGNNCCAKKVFVKVKRCPKDFLIYQLPAAPSGSYRYCGSKRREKPAEGPTKAPPVKTGEDKNHPGKSCKVIRELNSQGGTGLYWINPSGGKAFRAYCDQEIDGGGWTLVYSYTFTNYPNFVDGSNAVTPRPSWPAVGDIPISKKVPLKETQLGAMDFKFWRQIGNEFMVKSNINHWIACKEVNGSLVDYKAGSLSCKVIKNVASVCPNVAPDEIRVLTKESSANYGPHLYYSKSITELKTYYYWESSTLTGNWPTHDPCGKNGLFHVRNVVNPYGNIFIR